MSEYTDNYTCQVKYTKKIISSGDIISRMKEITGLSQKALASQVFDISEQAMSGQITRNRIDLRKVVSWGMKEKIDLNWIIHGDGHPAAGLTPRAMTDDEREWFRDLISQLQEDKQDLKSKLAAVEKKPEPEQRKNIKKVT